MPTPTTYDYPVTDTANDVGAMDSLLLEIQAKAEITIALDGEPILTVVSDVPTIRCNFKDDLEAQSPDQKPHLDAVIAAHQGVGITPAPDHVQIDNVPSVQVRKPSGLENGRVYGFSVNFCDKTTWYHEAVEVVDEAVGTGDGTTTSFALARGTDNDANERILDMCHGKVSDENRIPNPRGEFRGYGNGYVLPSGPDPFASTAPLSGYVPIVKVNGVEQTERSFSGTDGDYEIDYVTGSITFYTAPTSGHSIEATYWYAPANSRAHTIVVAPAGKRYMIDRVEIQSSPDACFNSDLVMNVYAGAPWPNAFPVDRPTVIKKIHDIVNWAYGARAQIPAQGGDTNPRRLEHAVNIHQVRYTSEIPLLSSAAMYMQVNTADNQPFDGTWATVVIYGIEETE